MDFKEIEKNVTIKMEATMSNLKKELSGIRTGRASVHFLDSIFVEAYGGKMPMNQLATVTAPEARLLSVQVWDKTVVKAVEKAIANSDLGVNPTSEGQTIRVPLPNLSEERRVELVKIAKKLSENSKISIRNSRRDGNEELKKLEKTGEISKDELFGNTQKLQDLTDKFIEKIDQEVETKEKEIMHI